MISNPKAEKWAAEFCKRFGIDRKYVTDEFLETEYKYFDCKGAWEDVGEDRV